MPKTITLSDEQIEIITEDITEEIDQMDEDGDSSYAPHISKREVILHLLNT